MAVPKEREERVDPAGEAQGAARRAVDALVPPASRTASDAKTIAEPSGAPGPGYTLPKTDAAELPAAYSPAM